MTAIIVPRKPFKIRLSKSFDFDAAHRLDMLPSDHKCHRLHGHTYRVELVCEGFVRDAASMLIDYAELAKAWAPLHDMLDHHYLNEVPDLGHPTTEAVAAFIAERLFDAANAEVVKVLKTVRVYESATTWCEVNADWHLPF